MGHSGAALRTHGRCFDCGLEPGRLIDRDGVLRPHGDWAGVDVFLDHTTALHPLTPFDHSRLCE